VKDQNYDISAVTLIDEIFPNRIMDGFIPDRETIHAITTVGGAPSTLNKPIKDTTYLVSISSKRKRPFNRLPYGTVQIRINNTQKFHHIMGWIEWMKGYLSKIKTLKMPE